MQPVKYLCCLTILFASCRGIRQTTALPADVDHLPIAYALSPKALPNEPTAPEPVLEAAETADNEEIHSTEKTTAETSATLSKVASKKITSFAQVKEMAANGGVKMSRRHLKVLNKLEKKYKGNFEQFRADSFEFTTTAKVVAAVGLIGLILAVFTGSWFGAFLFLLAALGFILRFIGAIEF